MKSIKITFGIITLILVIVSINSWLKYSKIKIGTKSSEVRLFWGKPSYTGKSDSLKFVDVYKTTFNKYVFIYSKKDNILLKKWKEN